MKHSLIIYFLFFCSIFFWETSPSYAQKEQDSIVVVRKFDENKLIDYKNDKDYAYDSTLVPSEETWWDRFKQWLFKKIFDLFFKEDAGKQRWVAYTILAGIIVYVIMSLLKANLSGAFSFRNKQKQVLDYEDLSGDVENTDFDPLIDKAILEQNFDLAIRFMFLKSLNLLSKKKLIEWKVDKTNIEYYYELSKQAHLQSKFRSVSFWFDYTFYGDFHLSEVSFAKAKNMFDDFYKSVNG